MSAAEEAMSAAEKLLQRWRRCGGLLLGPVVQRETGAHACGRAGTLPWRGRRYTGSRGTRWGGGQDVGWPCLPSNKGGIAGAGPDDSRRGRVRDPQARSGGGPREAFLAETR